MSTDAMRWSAGDLAMWVPGGRNEEGGALVKLLEEPWPRWRSDIEKGRAGASPEMVVLVEGVEAGRRWLVGTHELRQLR